MTHDPEPILAALRRCRTVEQVNATARLYGGAVQDMAKDPVLFVRALHIRNLAEVMRVRLGEGWVPEGADDEPEQGVLL